MLYEQSVVVLYKTDNVLIYSIEALASFNEVLCLYSCIFILFCFTVKTLYTVKFSEVKNVNYGKPSYLINNF